MTAKGGEAAVRVDGDRLAIGDRFTVAFQRTLRVPEDGRVYPLPPGLGRLPLFPAEKLGGYLIPLHHREALWLGFGGAVWKPNALQVGAGEVNAVSGGPFAEGLSDTPQNYLVCPQQPWLDGINTGSGQIRQFVALPLDDPRTVEAQLRGETTPAGLQLRLYEPHAGRFPDEPPPERGPRPAAGSMGLGAGGRIAQRIHQDPFGLDTWDPRSATLVRIHLVDPRTFTELTGRPAPPTPVDAATYARHGLPWFELYDGDAPAVPPSPDLAGVTPTGGEDEDEASVEVDPATIAPIRPRR
jgi:hypothetical protein